MNGHLKRTRLLIKLLLLAIFSLSCSGVTIAIDTGYPTAESVIPTQQIGLDFAVQSPSLPEGDASASLHLFLHNYHVPNNGLITGVTYLNDSDTISESFDLLILRPDNQGWKVLHRINLSDDSPPAETGITLLALPSPLSVQKNDIFAHWQYEAEGAIPLNIDNASFDGFSMGQYGFLSSDIEIGQHINKDGFSGLRDYFINIIFTTTP
ncbi:MAG: hypothetical protein HY863_12290 [Chloroflexi bacterium]|nr:hypothetical protein [Chloroflexota bacterium]